MKKAIVIVVLVLTIGISSVRTARAYDCCDPWGWVGYAAFVQAGSMVIASITGALTSIVSVIELQLAPSWGGGFGKHAAELSKQTATQKVFRQGALAVQSQLYLQERSGEAAERGVLAAQQSITVTNAALMAEQKNVVRDKIAKAGADFSGEFYSAKAVDPSMVVDRHKAYCSGADQELGRCDKVASPTMQNADLSINTIINPGDGQYETLADEERDAANAFVRNVVNPVPSVRLPSQASQSAQGKAVDAVMLADQAALSVAAHSFNSMIANRTRRRQQ